jgi:hypothetical protein
MIVLGILLALLGYFLAIGVLETIGIILVVVGAVLLLIGHVGPIGGRWW